MLRAAARGLAANDRDLPFTVTYLFDADGAAHVAGMTNVVEGSELARRAVATRDALWDVGSIWRDAQPIEVDLVPDLGLPDGRVEHPADARGHRARSSARAPSIRWARCWSA